MSGRSYEGPALDGTVQHISESPAWAGDGETIDDVDDSAVGEETTEDVPVPDGGATADGAGSLSGQATIGDWGPIGYVVDLNNGHDGYCVEVAPSVTYCRTRFDPRSGRPV